MQLPLWHEEDIEYDMHINVLSLITVARLYVLLRVLRNRVGYRSPHAAYVGKVNGVKADSVSFALKLLLKKRPWGTIMIVWPTTLLATTMLVSILYISFDHMTEYFANLILLLNDS